MRIMIYNNFGINNRMSLRKNALVLGSSGFIGGHLVKELVEDGYNVVGVDIRPIRYDIFKPTVFLKGDLREISFVESLFTMYYDEVFQLAADMGGATYINCGTYDGSVMSNSVIINSNVAKCCAKHNVGKLFFASSACVYPHSDDSIATCKEEDAYPAFPDNEYGWEKLFSERMYKGFERQYKLNIIIARFHSIVGDYAVWDNDRSKAHSAIALKIAQVSENGTIEIIGDGNQIRTFLYVKDCIKAIRTLMKINCKEILNIGSDVCVTINDYIDILRRISGKKFNIKYIDGPTGVKFRYCNIDCIKKVCDWQPETSFEESAKITYEYISNELDKRQNILFMTQPNGFINDSTNSFCGIGIRGHLTSEILTQSFSTKYNFIRETCNSNAELEGHIINHKPVIIIYNYHSHSTPWLNDSVLRDKYNNIKHVMIHYDLLQEHIDNFNPSRFVGFNYIITDNDKLNNTKPNNVFIVPRSIPWSPLPSNENRLDTIPKIGFQGFCGSSKKIDRIAHQIQNEFDEAIFRMHMPNQYYECESGINYRNHLVEEIKRIITKPGIKIEISYNFLSDEDIVKWLNENTINCYFYDYLPGSGIASSPDYAIAAKRPIAINNSRMFVNLHNLEPSIEIEKSTLKQIIANGITPLIPLYHKYSHENVVRKYIELCDTLLID
jgi:GDP-D-mannose 3', 5'-epimerase